MKPDAFLLVPVFCDFGFVTGEEVLLEEPNLSLKEYGAERFSNSFEGIFLIDLSPGFYPLFEEMMTDTLKGDSSLKMC